MRKILWCSVSFSASDLPSSASSITLSLYGKQTAGDAFGPYVYVGDSSIKTYSNIEGSATKYGVFSQTKGDKGYNTLTCVIDTEATTFLTELKNKLYVYLYGSNPTYSSSTAFHCVSLTIKIHDGATTYVWGSKTTSYSYPIAAMTSNSSQSCVASASTEYSSNYRAYRAFDNSTTTKAWASSTSDTSPYIQLQMPQALCNLTFTITNRGDRDDHINGPLTGIFYGSNDGSTWTKIGTFTRSDGETKGGGTSTHSCTNTTAYKYARVSISTWADDGSKFVCIGELSISGTITTTGWQSAVPYVWTTDATAYTYPKGAMTSATSAECTASASSEYSSNYPAWRAFDDSTSTKAWASSRDVDEAWLILQLPRKLCNITMTITNRADHDTLVNGPISGFIQGSNDGSTWTDLKFFYGRDGATKAASSTHSCDNNVGYSLLRIYTTNWDLTTGSSSQNECCIGECSVSGYDVSPTLGGWKLASSKVF